MLKSKTGSQLVTDQLGTQGKRSSMADDIQPDHAPKKRGNLATTLDPLLEPRLAAGQPGRPRDVREVGRGEGETHDGAQNPGRPAGWGCAQAGQRAQSGGTSHGKTGDHYRTEAKETRHEKAKALDSISDHRVAGGAGRGCNNR